MAYGWNWVKPCCHKSCFAKMLEGPAIETWPFRLDGDGKKRPPLAELQCLGPSKVNKKVYKPRIFPSILIPSKLLQDFLSTQILPDTQSYSMIVWIKGLPFITENFVEFCNPKCKSWRIRP